MAEKGPEQYEQLINAGCLQVWHAREMLDRIRRLQRDAQKHNETVDQLLREKRSLRFRCVEWRKRAEKAEAELACEQRAGSSLMNDLQRLEAENARLREELSRAEQAVEYLDAIAKRGTHG